MIKNNVFGFVDFCLFEREELRIGQCFSTIMNICETMAMVTHSEDEVVSVWQTLEQQYHQRVRLERRLYCRQGTLQIA